MPRTKVKADIVRVLSALTAAYTCLHESAGMISDPHVSRHLNESIEKMHVGLNSLKEISDHVRSCEHG